MVDNGGWRRRDARISALLCANAVGMWRAYSFNHDYAMDDGYDDKYTAWEPVQNRNNN